MTAISQRQVLAAMAAVRALKLTELGEREIWWNDAIEAAGEALIAAFTDDELMPEVPGYSEGHPYRRYHS